MGKDYNLANFIKPICDNHILSGNSYIDLTREAECSFNKDKLQDVPIQIRNIIQGYCNVDQGLESKGSIHNNLTLTNWNKRTTDFYEAISTSFDIQTT